MLGKVMTAPDAHCVAADDRGNAYSVPPRLDRFWFSRTPFRPPSDALLLEPLPRRKFASITSRCKSGSYAMLQGAVF
jgi:hypothetical protein